VAARRGREPDIDEMASERESLPEPLSRSSMIGTPWRSMGSAKPHRVECFAIDGQPVHPSIWSRD
jgi:hypothetical protein